MVDPTVELVGESHRIAVVRDTVRRLLARQRPGQRLPAILIQGETGTGKGLVARLLHRGGVRHHGPFVDVNCAAIPDTLLEAELFGFERGAFSDAHRAKPGLFQAAHGGILFLDEIGLLAEGLQAKLLTAIEERAVRRLGSTRPEPADVWLISATNRDLRAAVAARRFREDLYHRIAVITLELPSLRHLGRDILLLANRFLARTCADYGLASKRLDTAAEGLLLAYPWFGNVRELANVIERAVVLTANDIVTADDLGLSTPDEVGTPAPVSASTATSREESLRQRLVAALEETGWNISLTAARLGLARNTVYARLQKFGLRPELSHPTTPREPLPVTPTSAPGIRLHWERRSVTFLRARLDSGDIVETWSQSSRALEEVIGKVGSFGGRVEEITPSDLVAAFGVEPIDDAPRRAAHAAIAIEKGLQHLRRDHAAVPQVTLGLQVASVLTGRVGERIEIDARDRRAQLAVLTRLQEARRAGDTLVSAAAEPFLERRFELTRVDGGGDADGPVYRLTGRERRGLALWGSMTRLVGRDDALRILRSQVRLAADGRGVAVAIAGEPGIGKSRLVFELSRSPHVHGWLVLETRAAPYGKAASYLPVADLLRSYFAIDDRDTHDDIRAKVAGAVRTLDGALEPTLPALLGLLDVPVNDAGWRALDAAERRRRTHEAIWQLLLREARDRPLLLILEDLHWVDDQTQAVLDGLIKRLGAARVLLVVNYRPEYERAWAAAVCGEVRLDTLPVESAAELLDELLGDDAGLAPLKQRLVQHGNPFFLEEMVRTLVETKALAGEPGRYRLVHAVPQPLVPRTVEAMLAARIDRLPPEDKRLLQIAAVIGQDVPLALLQTVAESPEHALERGLERLQTAGLLIETGLGPDVAYAFKHALTCEVAYGSLLIEQRRTLHARIAGAFQQLYAGRLAEQVEQLAQHALKGELWGSAVQYLWQAATKATERYALREAETLFNEALSALAHLPENRATLEQTVDIRFGLNIVVTFLGDFRVARENLSEAERFAERLGDERRRGRVYSAKANVHNHAGEMDEALVWGARALEIADRLDDRTFRWSITNVLEQTHYMRGEFERVIDLARATLSALPADAVYRGGRIPVSVYDRGWLVRGLSELGRFAEAAEPAEAALRIAERTQHPYAIGWACMCAGNLHSWKGDWDTARSLYERGIGVFREANLVTTLSNVTAVSSWALACLGDPAALSRAREGERLLEVSREQRRISGSSYSYIWLCHAYLRLGQVEDAERVVPRVLEPPVAWSEAFECHLRGEIAARPDRWRPVTAEDCYRRALALAAPLGMRPLVALCHLSLGKLHVRWGRPDEARQHLANSIPMLRQMQMEYWLAQAEAELSTLG